MPGINTTFAMGGSGAVDGGLAQAARTQAVADAFARQYGQERANQIAAGNRLLDNQTQRAQQQLTAGNQLLSDQGRRLSSQIGAGSQLGSLALGNTAQMQSALTNALRGRQAAGSVMANVANQGTRQATECGSPVAPGRTAEQSDSRRGW